MDIQFPVFGRLGTWKHHPLEPDGCIVLAARFYPTSRRRRWAINILFCNEKDLASEQQNRVGSV